MLERVFDKRDEQHRRYLDACRAGNVVVFGDWGSCAQAHQGNVVVDELNLVLQRNPLQLVVVEYVVEHPRQLKDGCLRLLLVLFGECVDVVERVEHEVGIDLPPQVLQFGLCLSRLCLVELLFGYGPTPRPCHGSGYSGCY